jgi:hypothetical protein
MDPCWSKLPYDVFRCHVLPHCDIDVRIAFHAMPVRLTNSERRFTKLTAFLRNRDKYTVHFSNGYGQHHYWIPIWQPGEDKMTRFSALRIYITVRYIVGLSIDQLLTPLSAQAIRSIKESTRIEVNKIDNRCQPHKNNTIASLNISPDGTFQTILYSHI